MVSRSPWRWRHREIHGPVAAPSAVSSLAVTSLVTNQFAKRLWKRPRPSRTSVPLPPGSVDSRRPTRCRRGTRRVRPHSPSASAWKASPRPGPGAAGRVGGVVAGSHGCAPSGRRWPVSGSAPVSQSWAVACSAGGGDETPCHRAASDRDTATPDGQGSDDGGQSRIGQGTGARVVDEVRNALPGREDRRTGSRRRPGRRSAFRRRGCRGAGDRGRRRHGVDGGGDRRGRTATACGVPSRHQFNHFANHSATSDATPWRKLLRPCARATCHVDLVRIDEDRMIVNTASIGAYPLFVETREKLREQGRQAAGPGSTCDAAHVATRPTGAHPLRQQDAADVAVLPGEFRLSANGFRPIEAPGWTTA